MASRMLALNTGRHRFPSMFEVLTATPVFIAPSALLSLPREIRDLIYDEFIWTCHEASVKAKDPEEQDPGEQDLEEQDLEDQSPPLLTNLTASKKRPSQITDILLVNRQIHAEFRSQLYRLVHGRYITYMLDNNRAFSWNFRLYSMHNARPHMVHLRHLKLVLETPDEPKHDTTWCDLHHLLKRNVETILRALPNLENLEVTVMLRPYFHTPLVPAQTYIEKTKILRIDHITGLQLGGGKKRGPPLRPVNGQPPRTKVPKDINSGFFKPEIYHSNPSDTLRELRAKQDALMHPSDGQSHTCRFHPRLQTFTKKLAMRFTCSPKNPMIFDTQKDIYDEQSGVLKKTEKQKMPWLFVEEWGAATSEEVSRLLAVSLGPGWWFTWCKSKVLTPNQLGLVFDAWQIRGKPTRERIEEEWEEWEETHKNGDTTCASEPTSSDSTAP